MAVPFGARRDGPEGGPRRDLPRFRPSLRIPEVADAEAGIRGARFDRPSRRPAPSPKVADAADLLDPPRRMVRGEEAEAPAVVHRHGARDREGVQDPRHGPPPHGVREPRSRALGVRSGGRPVGDLRNAHRGHPDAVLPLRRHASVDPHARGAAAAEAAADRRNRHRRRRCRNGGGESSGRDRKKGTRLGAQEEVRAGGVLRRRREQDGAEGGIGRCRRRSRVRVRDRRAGDDPVLAQLLAALRRHRGRRQLPHDGPDRGSVPGFASRSRLSGGRMQAPLLRVGLRHGSTPGKGGLGRGRRERRRRGLPGGRPSPQAGPEPPHPPRSDGPRRCFGEHPEGDLAEVGGVQVPDDAGRGGPGPGALGGPAGLADPPAGGGPGPDRPVRHPPHAGLRHEVRGRLRPVRRPEREVVVGRRGGGGLVVARREAGPAAVLGPALPRRRPPGSVLRDPVVDPLLEPRRLPALVVPVGPEGRRRGVRDPVVGARRLRDPPAPLGRLRRRRRSSNDRRLRDPDRPALPEPRREAPVRRGERRRRRRRREG
mmetsp:Transcript_2730/g.7501  ORF Transcript_2730/g.7501 Transcript_2730/m.7501 type:complete len:541 (-) Transcript_2730:247-1869(-)